MPQGVDSEPLARWTKPPVQDERGVYPEREFAEALADAGLVLSAAPMMDGNLHRVPAVGDEPGQKSGAYVGHLDGHPAGFIQNYKTGYESKWKSNARMARLSQEERERLEAEAEKRKVEREQERQHLADETALLVAAVWSASELAEAHPYLAAKGVQSYGLRVNTQEALALVGNKTDEPQRWSGPGALLVPVHDADGKFLGAQSIDATGNKSFPRGSRLQGGQFIIGEPSQSDMVLIAEGYATAATVHELTKLPVIVAFHSGNLPAVAEAFHKRHPEKILVIAGDDDHSKPIEKNVGRLKAQEAAEKVGGYALFPRFDKNASGSDWNDLVKQKGPDEVRQVLKAGIGMAQIQHRAKQLRVEQEQAKEQEKQFLKTQEAEKAPVLSEGRLLAI